MQTPEPEDQQPVLIVAALFVHAGREAEFRQFETSAARIMWTYGGRIERVIRPTVTSPGSPVPYEIHLVSFPSLERFEQYRADPRLGALAALRETAIARTEITIGYAEEPYDE
jgi:hypothetical protein